MIGAIELENVREINRKLPFAHPIEQGPEFVFATDLSREESAHTLLVARIGGEQAAPGDRIIAIGYFNG